MNLVEHFREMALNNAWSNQRLLSACARLSDAAFAAERVSFFPSLEATLNHILIVDWYYLDALVEGGRGYAIFDDELPYEMLPELALAQLASDRRLIDFCNGLAPGDLARGVKLDRAARGIKHELVGACCPISSSIRSTTGAKPTPCCPARR